MSSRIVQERLRSIVDILVASHRGGGQLSASASDLSLTKDSQIGANLRVCADEEDRADFDRRN
jgi:hypothetical protein